MLHCSLRSVGKTENGADGIIDAFICASGTVKQRRVICISFSVPPELPFGSGYIILRIPKKIALNL